MKKTLIIVPATLLPLILGSGSMARAQDYQAYYENAQRLGSPHAYNHQTWPTFAKNDHAPHIDEWGRDLNGPPFRTACHGMYHGTGYHGCGTMTGGPVGGLPTGN